MVYYRGFMSKEEKELRSRLAKLVHREEFVYGSIVTSDRKCGKPNCWCKERKRYGHESSYLSVQTGKERKMIFIPQEMVEKVKEWINTYKEINSRIIKISNSCVERLREE